MSDFLRRLVEKNLNRIAVVQPRLPSLFERPLYSEPLPHQSGAEEMALEVATESEPIKTAERSAVQKESPSAVQPEIEPNAIEQGPAEQIKPRRVRAGRIEPDEPIEAGAVRGPASLTRKRPSIKTPASRPQPSAAPRTLTGDQPSTALMPSAQPSASLQDEPAHRANQTAVRTAELVPRKQTAQPTDNQETTQEAREPLVLARPLEPQQVQQVFSRPSVQKQDKDLDRPVDGPAIVGRPQTPATPRPALLTESPLQEESVTVVQVNIGRIEVRAAPPISQPAPRQVQRRSLPTLSLDEYLRRRDEGKR